MGAALLSNQPLLKKVVILPIYRVMDYTLLTAFISDSGQFGGQLRIASNLQD